MKILNAEQLRLSDANTIEQDSISSTDLMERAAQAFVEAFTSVYPDSDSRIFIFAGPGNNGGDALAIARLLLQRSYAAIAVYLFNTKGKLSADCAANKKRLESQPGAKLEEILTQFTPPTINPQDIIIDGLFGTGLSRPLQGGFASVVRFINSCNANVVSIDMPSGLMCEDNLQNIQSHIVRAQRTFTFQYPKLSFLFPENEPYCGEWQTLDIGIKDPETNETATPYILTEGCNIRPILHSRSAFAHKGTMGHAVLVAGHYGMAGAAILASKACMRSGVGKLTLHTPSYNLPIIQNSIPEVIVHADANPDSLSQPFDTSQYEAMAIGPGIGTEPTTMQMFSELLTHIACPLIIDADGLNILAMHHHWMARLPKNTILTPHIKELSGLTGICADSYERLQRTRTLARERQVYIIIKGRYSAICCPDGMVYFNSTGNPGMATSGSGDVLTGIIISFVAQGYSALHSCLLGVYLHGLAGDKAAERLGYESLIASDIIDGIAPAFQTIRNYK